MACGVAAFAWLACLTQSGIAQITAPVFTVNSLADGLAGAKGDQVFVVYVSGIVDSDNPETERAWRDPRVLAWMTRHGRAMVQVADNIAVPVRELGAFAGDAIAFRVGVEFDRDARLRTADELLEWLALVGQGSIPSDYAERRDHTGMAQARGARDRAVAAYTLGLRRERSGRPADAFSEYLKALPDLEDRMSAFRYGQVVRRVKDLAPSVPGAPESMARLRDEAERTLEPTPEAVARWLGLYETAPEPDRLFGWYKRVVALPEWKLVLRNTSQLWVILMGKSERWEQLGSTIQDEPALLELWGARPRMLRRMSDAPKPQGQGAALIAQEELLFAVNASMVYGGLLAAKQDARAEAVADRAFAIVDTPDCRRTFVEAAIQAGQARPVHLEWAKAVEKADPGGPPLISKVESALEIKR